MDMRTGVTAVALVLATGAGAVHGEPLSADEYSAGIGGDVKLLDRKLEVSGPTTTRIDLDGSLAGVHGYFQRGPTFRIEARALLGNIDIESEDIDEAEPAAFTEARATFGTTIRDGDRVYGGVALDSLYIDGPADSGDIQLSSVYIPVGYSTAGDFARHWRAIARIEGRYVLFGRDRFDAFEGGEDVDFHRRGGFGIAAAVTFRSKDAPFEIQPYVEFTEYSTSETETVDGVDLRTKDQRTAAGGVRVHWRF